MAIITHNVDGGFGKRTKTTITPTKKQEPMKAADARALTDEGQKVDMEAIYNQIEANARQGNESLTINVQKWKHKASVAKVIDELRANGFKASRNYGSDQRDGDSWDNITITW
jgi:biopolymer transport protein ExbD